MKKVKYIGTFGIRELSKEDFVGVGVTDQGAIRVHGPNLYDPVGHKVEPTVEVSEAAAKYLVEHEEFAIVTDGDDDSDESSKAKGSTKKAAQ